MSFLSFDELVQRPLLALAWRREEHRGKSPGALRIANSSWVDGVGIFYLTRLVPVPQTYESSRAGNRCKLQDQWKKWTRVLLLSLIGGWQPTTDLEAEVIHANDDVRLANRACLAHLCSICDRFFYLGQTKHYHALKLLPAGN